MKSSEYMLIAIRSGVVEDRYGELREVTAGRDRISPRKLAELPRFAEFFEPDFGDPRFPAERSVIRTSGPGSVGAR